MPILGEGEPIVSQPKMDNSQIGLRVNGISFTSAQLCNSVDAPEGCDVMIDDPAIGAFRLHSDFDLEVQEESSLWRPVTLDELKKILAVEKKCCEATFSNSSDRLERKGPDCLEDIDLPLPRCSRLGELTGHYACVRLVQSIFYKGGMPHLVAGTVFTVPSVPKARICLKQAGFQQSEIYPTALIDPRSRCAIQLVERRAGIACGNGDGIESPRTNRQEIVARDVRRGKT
jgi:hypothetical protein